MPSLGASYGRGAATMPQWELANADCILVMGSNMAENHPIAFRFALQAKDKGATLIHADPRFTRTSALVDLHAPLRAWLRDRFTERVPLLYAWSAKLLEAIEYERYNAPPAARANAYERALRDTLDALAELGILVEPLVPEAVFSWYRNN